MLRQQCLCMGTADLIFHPETYCCTAVTSQHFQDMGEPQLLHTHPLERQGGRERGRESGWEVGGFFVFRFPDVLVVRRDHPTFVLPEPKRCACATFAIMESWRHARCALISESNIQYSFLRARPER